MDIDQLFAKFQLEGDFTRGLDQVWLYQKYFSDKSYTLYVRPVCLEADISMMHRWATHPLARKFWQAEPNETLLYNYYRKEFSQKLTFSFLIFLEAIPVAQADVYQVLRDETASHYQAAAEDYGLHLLMAPYKEILSGAKADIKRLSVHVLVTMLGFLFSFDSVQRVMAEPDRENKAANRLAQATGYRFMKQIELSCKKANLYCYEKEDFLEAYP